MSNDFAICISDLDDYSALDTLYINNFEFKRTCVACPEQYDVFDEYGVQVAYIRLRHGCLRVDAPDCGGDTIYTHEFRDNLLGCFDNDNQRMRYLTKIAKLLLNK